MPFKEGRPSSVGERLEHYGICTGVRYESMLVNACHTVELALVYVMNQCW